VAKPEIKERRQAEFLVHDHFPWSSIEGVGVHDQQAAARVAAILTATSHRPPVAIKPAWYYL
jgi:hypothetical protein